MKSRPEYRAVFSSPTALYRVIHTISTQKYRLPVRRYIFDLFNVDLDMDVIKVFMECEKSLRLPPQAVNGESSRQTERPPRVISIFSHHVIPSDESDVEDDISELQEKQRRINSTKRPISLRPAKTVVGFDGS
jgi:hypothetical protein